jgi:hypothetical protein
MCRRVRGHFKDVMMPKLLAVQEELGVRLPDVLCTLQGKGDSTEHKSLLSLTWTIGQHTTHMPLRHAGTERRCANSSAEHHCNEERVVQAIGWPPAGVPLVNIGGTDLRSEEYDAYMKHYQLDTAGLEARR